MQSKNVSLKYVSKHTVDTMQFYITDCVFFNLWTPQRFFLAHSNFSSDPPSD